MFLCIKTDSSEAEILVINDNQSVVAQRKWQSDRELSNQLLQVITDICEEANTRLSKISGIIVYQGPGSYTGLRISMSTANAIAYSENLPIVGSTDEDWIENGLIDIELIKNFKPISPNYGGEVYTTKPKK